MSRCLITETTKEGQSYYIYNGLGYLVANEYVVRQNNYGYVGVSTTPTIPGVTVSPQTAKAVHKFELRDHFTSYLIQ